MAGKLARIAGWVVAIAVAGWIVWFYFWTVRSAGALDPGATDYYKLLVRGFRQGHLYMELVPPKELVALKDPYDPAQNGPYRMPDASYWHGHYYLYFGAAPAVTVMLPYALVTGREMYTGTAVWIFCTAGFVTASAVWLALRRRYFPRSGAWVPVAGVLALGLGSHLLALPRRAMWWELPIAAGFAFTMLALGAVYRAVHGRRPVVWLGAAGLLLGLAAASRPTCLFAVPMLAAPLWVWWREGSPAWWRAGLAAGGALGVMGILILAYNGARFGNPLEFGQNLQLSGSYEGHERHFSLGYVGYNLRTYFFSPVEWAGQFPFVTQGRTLEFSEGHAPGEAIAGQAWAFPVVWFLVAVPLVWRGAGRRAEGVRLAESAAGWKVMLGAVALAAAGLTGIMAVFFSTTPRYAADFAPMVTLLALCGLLGAEAWVQRARWGARIGLAVVTLGLAVVTAGTGVLASFDYHGRVAGQDDPDGWLRVQRGAEAALVMAGTWAGQLPGPVVLKVRFRERPAGTVETFWQPADPRAGEKILVKYESGRELLFGYAHGAEPVQWGRPVAWTPGHTHTIGLQLPSLYGDHEDAMGRALYSQAFRMRSGMELDFSGGRVLAGRVAARPAGLKAGGAPGADFSGEVRGIGRRAYRDEDVDGAGSAVLPDPKGGALRLTLVLPARLDPAGEPLLAAGGLYNSDIVYLREADARGGSRDGGGSESAGAVQVVLAHSGAAEVVSRPLRLDRAVPHVVEIVLPSCRTNTFSLGMSGDAIVRVDGEEAIRTRLDAAVFPAGSERIGSNTLGKESGCGRDFRGWMIEAKWTLKDESGSNSRD